MSTEYYLVCPERKKVLELYKKHQYLSTLNGIEQCGGYKDFLAVISEDEQKSEVSQRVLDKVLAFIKDCSGCQIFHFDDNQWIDWWNDHYPNENGLPGMSKVYSPEWEVYEW